ncbi:MAG: K(+)-stimulated pyrophosphate-energized sodium pump [Acidobacteriaceae bacterium]|jgi:K(+)-stimulated pyrophosphate-energized sodium pump|nr:K(+)-stimulated pyrophosphate-energized sodium pump [Acidobacteriaceae bacterium]
MVFFSLSATVFWQGSTAAIDTSGSTFLWIAMIAGLLGLVFALFLARSVLAYDTGTPEMRMISNAIREGAEAFMSRQYTTIGALAVVLAVALFVGYKFSDFTAPLAGKVVISFLIGAICSGFAGFTGMFVSIRTNIRAASAARSSLGQALKIALHGGAVTGMVVISLSLLGVGALFFLFGGLQDPQHVPYQLVGFGFGASLVALFAQLGGGIYTKAADVGADLVGKVEAGIPEDDPRNPAVIADLVGDNVGDCAGRGADIFESTAAENVGAMILGTALYPVFGIKGILFPLMVHAINLVASFIGVLAVHSREDQDPMDALNRGYYVTTLLALAGFAGAVYYMLQGRWWLLSCGVVGIVTSFLFVRITEYYTETRYRPVQSIANASLTGPATNIISGLAVGMETPAMPVVVISAALLLSYYFGVRGLADTSISDYAKGIYGTAIATMGMLSSAAYILAMDTFGPITDNAGGIIEMSDQPDSVREKTDKLDAAGNTTKALTKGYAIGSAALAAFLLFSAYLETVHGIVAQRFAGAQQTLDPSWSFTNINLASVPVFVGALLGAMLIFLFSSFAIKAVGRTAQYIIEDVRAQFRENPGIMAGTSKPDYGRCVRIVTGAALKQMVLPGALAVLTPLAVGLVFRNLSGSFHIRIPGEYTPMLHGRSIDLAGAEAVAALLMVGTIVGILMAMLMNNSGGAWDNAKKYIETGAHGGKRSEAHKAAVVGDTVGDPFKDTAGPSLHVLIKLLATVTLVLAPLFL